MSRIITEWIPVTERMPGYYEDCLVTIRLTSIDGRHAETVVDAALHYGDKDQHYIGQFDTWNDWLEDCKAEVIAWMPFPVGYREEV